MANVTLEAFKQQRAILELDTPEKIQRAQIFDQGLKKFEETLKARDRTIEVIESSLRFLEDRADRLQQTG